MQLIDTSGNSFILKGKNINYSFSQQLKNNTTTDDDSSSETIQTGNKPYKISVSLTISKANKDNLSELNQVCQRIRDDGERMVYQITHITAQSLGISKVIFDGDIRINDDSASPNYTITFKLFQKLTRSETEEERRPVATVNESQNNNTVPIKQGGDFFKNLNAELKNNEA